MNKYEAFYIVKPEFSEEDVQKIADKYKTLVEEKGGTVESAASWDYKRKLAYEIDDHKEGSYILMNFACPASLPLEINRQMRINDDILRHRIFRLED